MTITELRWALDKFEDSDHNDDEIVLIQQPGERYSLAVLHADGQSRPYEALPDSNINFTFRFTNPKEDS